MRRNDQAGFASSDYKKDVQEASVDSDFNENSFTAKKTDEGGKSVQDLLKSESGGSSPETVLSRRKKCVISDSDTTWSESATEEEEEAYVSGRKFFRR